MVCSGKNKCVDGKILMVYQGGSSPKIGELITLDTIQINSKEICSDLDHRERLEMEHIFSTPCIVTEVGIRNAAVCCDECLYQRMCMRYHMDVEELLPKCGYDREDCTQVYFKKYSRDD